MTLDQLFQTVNYFAGKDKRGKTLSVTEFNTLLVTVQDTLYHDELSKLVIGDVQDIPQSRLSTTPLRPFLYSTSGTVTYGKFDLPTTYRRWVLVSVNNVPVEIVTQFEFNRRSTSVFRRPDVRLYGYIDRNSIRISDPDATLLDLQYFATPFNTAYYDYCQDGDTYNEIYMPVGSYIALDDSNVPTLYDSSAVVIQSNVIKDGVSTYPYNSKTVELQWEAIYHPTIAMALLSAVGVNIKEADITQYAEAK